ncbi:MAG: hypothetical protein IJO06_03510 [Thermoguttaceae bacterium]|nr:hypothetical protein [Thermoguttaceae bacterium]MBQ7110268.1 hypothetical protein [Thermoguttaceae bacterium]
MNKNESLILSRRAFCVGCVAGALGVGSLGVGSWNVGASAFAGEGSAGTGANARPLKSAAELVDVLRAKFGKPFEIPARTGLDVLGAEQKKPRAVIFKADSDWNDPASIRWYWSAAEAPEVAPEHRGWFNNVSECKPAYGDRCVLIAASGGGVALVRVADKATLFYGLIGGNPHSAAVLPDGNVVAISSTGARIKLFALPEAASGPNAPSATGPTPVAAEYELKGGHGLVWDAKRRVLWALGSAEIVEFEYVGTKEKPELKEIWRAKLPGLARGGHDLYAAPGFDALVSTGAGVAVFDPVKREFFDVYERVAPNRHGVKSVSLTPNGSLPMILLPVEEWWTPSPTWGSDAEPPVGTLDGARFYKARWFVADEFSEIGDGKDWRK